MISLVRNVKFGELANEINSAALPLIPEWVAVSVQVRST
jgi:hypothetical protein